MSHVILPYEFDDDLMANVLAKKGPGLRVCPFGQTAVVAGRGSRVDCEIHMNRAMNDGIPVYRRKGGGCPVVLDQGTLIVSLALPAPGIGGIREWFNRCSHWLIRHLKTLGIEGIYKDGISDLVVEDRKVAGSCFYRTKGVALYSAAILVDTDLDLMDRYLPYPPREPDYRRGRSHKAFLARLDRFFPGMTASGLAREFRSLPSDLYTDRAA